MSEEDRKAVEKDMEEYERDFSKLSEIKKCPRCGGGLDEGYLMVPNIVGWKDYKPGLFRFSGMNKPLAQAPLRSWTGDSLPSLRCKKCHFVTFDYSSEVERGTVRE